MSWRLVYLSIVFCIRISLSLNQSEKKYLHIYNRLRVYLSILFCSLLSHLPLCLIYLSIMFVVTSAFVSFLSVYHVLWSHLYLCLVYLSIMAEWLRECAVVVVVL